MSEPTTTPSPPQRSRAAKSHRCRRRKLWHRATTVLLVAGAVVGSVYLLTPASSARAFGVFGPPHHCHHAPGHWRGPDKEEMQAHARIAAERVLDRIDATDGQREIILGVVDRAVADLAEISGDRFELRREILSELTAPSVDRASLESLRRRKLAVFDRLSRRVVDAVGEIAEVLSLEQRREIADHFRGRHG